MKAKKKDNRWLQRLKIDSEEIYEMVKLAYEETDRHHPKIIDLSGRFPATRKSDGL